MIPGSNLLNIALTVISRAPVEYHKFFNRTLNDIGYDVANYEDPVTIYGSLQPVPRTLYQEFGLDFSKSYFTFYTSNDVLTTRRDVSGDYFVFGGRRYQCEATNDWYAQDGWAGVLCVLQTQDE